MAAAFRTIPRALAVAVLLCSACDGGASSTSWHGSMRDSAGITVVANPAQGIWPDGAGWRTEPDLTIGTADGDPNVLFGHIAGICVGSEGRVYVVDVNPPSIRVFEPDGTFLRAFAAGGSGPGELGASLGPCLMGPGDTLAIPDLQNFQVTRFTPDGTVLTSIRFDVGEGIPIHWAIASTGRIAMQLRFGILNQSPNGTPDAIVWWTGSAAQGDTLLRLPVQAVRPLPSGRPRYTLLAGEPVWGVAPDGGLLHASSDAYRIVQHDSRGNPERVISKATERHLVTDTDRQILRAAVEEVFSRRVIEAVMGEIHFADHFPVLLQLRSGPHGSLWVQRVRAPSMMVADERERTNFGPEDPEVFFASPRLRLESPEWDVFDAQGRYLGVVTMPERFQPVQFVDDAIYGVWRDAMDVEYVQRLRIVMGETAR